MSLMTKKASQVSYDDVRQALHGRTPDVLSYIGLPTDYAAALNAMGANAGRWNQFAKSKSQAVVAIPIYAGESLDIVNWTIYSATGGTIISRRKNDDGQWVDEHDRKRVAFSGSAQVGVSVSVAHREAILAGLSIDQS